MRILTGTITSPTLAEQIAYVLKLFPQAKWHQWEPAVSDGAREGAKLAFGRYVNTVCRVEKANVILSLDADLLGSGPGHTRYSKEFCRRRTLSGPADEMNRLYAVEPTPSVTGSAADHRLPLRASEMELFARAIAAKAGSWRLGGASCRTRKSLQKRLRRILRKIKALRSLSQANSKRGSARAAHMQSTPRSAMPAQRFITPSLSKRIPSIMPNRCTILPPTFTRAKWICC